MDSPTPSTDRTVLPLPLNVDFDFTLPIAEVRELQRIANLISNQLLSDRVFFDGLVYAVSTAYEGERAVVFATRVYELLIMKEAEVVGRTDLNRFGHQNDVGQGVAEEFREKLERAACVGFNGFWDLAFKTKKFTPPRSRDTCIFIGGLAAVGIITYNQFKVLATKIITNFRTRSVLSAFTEMMRWASASPNARFVKEPVFLVQCMAMIRTRCQMYIRAGPEDARCVEETNATQLLEELLFHKGFFTVSQPLQQPSPPPSPPSESAPASVALPHVQLLEAPAPLARHVHNPFSAPAGPNRRNAHQVHRATASPQVRRRLHIGRPFHQVSPAYLRMPMHTTTSGTSTSTAQPTATRNVHYRTPAWACSPPAEDLNRTCPRHVLESLY